MKKEGMQKKKNILNIAYFGSPYFSAQLLEEILTRVKDDVQVRIVVTQPDKPAGRGMKLTQTAVKTVAQKYCIPVYDASLKDCPNKLKSLLDTYALDVALVYAFNEIVPEDILRIPTYGFWNVHPSLLPKYRGASPIAFPLIFNETKTGVSLIQMIRRMDAGPILGQKEVIIKVTDTQDDLQNKLTSLGFTLFVETLQTAISQKSALAMRQQNEIDSTYTFKLVREDGYIKLADLKTLIAGGPTSSHAVRLYERYAKKNPAKAVSTELKIVDLFNLWRGLNPWPGVWTLIPTKSGERRLKIIHMAYRAKTAHIDKVQIEGKSVVPFEVFLKGHPHIFS